MLAVKSEPQNWACKGMEFRGKIKLLVRETDVILWHTYKINSALCFWVYPAFLLVHALGRTACPSCCGTGDSGAAVPCPYLSSVVALSVWHLWVPLLKAVQAFSTSRELEVVFMFALHKKKAIKSRKFICLELFCTFSFLACTENSFQLECCDVEHAFASMYSFPSSPDFLLCDGIVFLVPVQQVAGGKIPFYFCVWMPEVSLKGSLEIILIEERLASHSVFWSRNRENSALFFALV